MNTIYNQENHIQKHTNNKNRRPGTNNVIHIQSNWENLIQKCRPYRKMKTIDKPGTPYTKHCNHIQIIETIYKSTIYKNEHHIQQRKSYTQTKTIHKHIYKHENNVQTNETIYSNSKPHENRNHIHKTTHLLQ